MLPSVVAAITLPFEPGIVATTAVTRRKRYKHCQCDLSCTCKLRVWIQTHRLYIVLTKVTTRRGFRPYSRRRAVNSRYCVSCLSIFLHLERTLAGYISLPSGPIGHETSILRWVRRSARKCCRAVRVQRSVALRFPAGEKRYFVFLE